MREQVNGAEMRQLEAKARELGRLISAGIGQGRGFALLVFSFDGPELTYISNAQRNDMINALEEFTARLRSGEGTQTWQAKG